MPQILDRLGYNGALHFVIDDGLYPDERKAGKHRWEGCDGSVIDAVSRASRWQVTVQRHVAFPQQWPSHGL
ncbi:MAG: hypothetical protein R3C02_02775 [Planctomycetaceae bacterium]